MRVSLIPICCCVLISSVYAYADDNSTELRELLRQFDDGKGNLDVTKLQAFYRRSGEAKTVKAAQKAAVAPVGEPVPPSDKPYVDAGSDEKLTGTHATLLLRK